MTSPTACGVRSARTAAHYRYVSERAFAAAPSHAEKATRCNPVKIGVGSTHRIGHRIFRNCARSGAGTLSSVVFSDYTPLSGNAELARRMLSPLTAAQIPALLARSGKRLGDQPVNGCATGMGAINNTIQTYFSSPVGGPVY